MRAEMQERTQQQDAEWGGGMAVAVADGAA